MAAIRKKFGAVDFFRVFQAHVKRTSHQGYPHVHLLLVFKDYVFRRTFLRWSLDRNRYIVRIQDKEAFEDAWPFGYVDVEVPGSVNEARTHVLRYIERFVIQADPEGDGRVERSFRDFQFGFKLTAGYQWYFGKRSFGFSKGWSSRLRASRLDTVQCITKTPKVKLLGFSSFIEARRAAVDPSTRQNWFQLATLPLDFVERPQKLPLATSEESHGLIKAGGRILSTPRIDQDWTVEEGPVYDELTVKQRARERAHWERERGLRR